MAWEMITFKILLDDGGLKPGLRYNTPESKCVQIPTVFRMRLKTKVPLSDVVVMDSVL